MSKLNDTQLILLSTAAQRDTASLYPLPTTVTVGSSSIPRAIAALVKLGLVEERETNDNTAAHRVDGDIRYGIFVTEVGLAAIDAGPTADDEPDHPTPPRARAGSKSEAVISLLERGEGATLAELIGATGWLPHTTRAALTGLRHKGYEIHRSKRDSETCYRIGKAD